MKKCVDVLEFVERDEQGQIKGREVLEFVERDEQGQIKGREVLDFLGDENEEPLAKKITAGSQEAPHNMGKDNDSAICMEGQILPLLRQNPYCPVTWTPADPFPATNFYVKILRKKIFLDRTGKEMSDRGEIECKIFVCGKEYDLVIKNMKIRSFARIVTDQIPEAIIDHEEKKAEKIVEKRFRQDIAQCRSVQIFCQAGWNRIDGRRLYVYDGIDLGNERYVDTGLTLPHLNCSRETLVAIFLRVRDLCRDITAISVMFATSLLGVLYRPFEEAGFRPRFLLFIHGKTGSMKTTLAKILYTQLCKDEFRDEPRRFDTDTEVSLERAIVTAGQDSVTLIDDFSPAKMETRKGDMTNKLETIIRMVGDGSSRSRSDIKLEDKRGEGVHGMVVLTGELMPKGLSSNLRCVFCRLNRDDVDISTVTWFQENEAAYTTLIASFAEYVGQNFDYIIQYIIERFNDERRRLFGILRERRLVDSAVTLGLVIDIFIKFLQEFCGLNDGAVLNVPSQMKNSIIDAVRISEQMSTVESPSEIFVSTLEALMRMGVIKIAEEKVSMLESGAYDGYSDGEFLCFLPESVHKKVIAFLKQTNRYFPYDCKEILVFLADDGISKTSSNGAGKRTLCARISMGNGKKINVLKIRKNIFDAVIDGGYDDWNGGK